MESLTHREIEVLKEMAEGYTNKAIAKRLSLCLKTVENHITRIYAALVCDRTHDRRVSAVLAYLRSDIPN